MGNDIPSLAREIREIRSTITGLRSSLENISKINNYDYVSRAEFNAFNTRVTAAIHYCGTQLDDVVTRLNDSVMPTITTAEASALKAGAQQVAAVAADFRQTVATIEYELRTLQNTVNSESGTLEQDVNRIDAALSAMESKVDYLTTCYGTVSANVIDMRRQYDNLDDDHSEIESDIDDLETDLASLTTTVSTATSNITTLQASSTFLGLRIGTSEGAIDALEANVATLQASDVFFGTRIGTNEGEIDGLTTVLASSTTNIQDLISDVGVLQASSIFFGSEIGLVEGGLQNTDSILASSVININQLLYDVDHIDTMPASSVTDIQTLYNRISTLESTVPEISRVIVWLDAYGEDEDTKTIVHGSVASGVLIYPEKAVGLTNPSSYLTASGWIDAWSTCSTADLPAADNYFVAQNLAPSGMWHRFTVVG